MDSVGRERGRGQRSGWDVAVLYRLEEILLAPQERWVFVVDGPEEVDRLWALGVAATCPLASREVTWAWTGLHSKALAGSEAIKHLREITPEMDLSEDHGQAAHNFNLGVQKYPAVLEGGNSFV